VSLGDLLGENATTMENHTTVIATVNGQVVYDSRDAENEDDGSLLNRHIGPLPYITGPMGMMGTGLMGVGGIGGIGGVGGIGGIGGMGRLNVAQVGNPALGLGTSSMIPLSTRLMLGML
jgi:hypothetical protein